jgi:hypothetical protein
MSRVEKMYFRTVRDEEEANPFIQWLLFGFAITFVVVGVMWGIRHFSDIKKGLNSTSSIESQGLLLRLSMKKITYVPGERIDVSLCARNVTPDPLKLEFESSLEFDLVVQSELDLKFAKVPQNIWQFSANSGKVPVAKLHSIVIEPGQEQAFNAYWDQRDLKGKMVEPGRYVLTGYLLAKDRHERLQVRGETSK